MSLVSCFKIYLSKVITVPLRLFVQSRHKHDDEFLSNLTVQELRRAEIKV